MNLIEQTLERFLGKDTVAQMKTGLDEIVKSIRGTEAETKLTRAEVKALDEKLDRVIEMLESKKK